MLVNDWKHAWKWVSTWCLAIILYISINGVPPEILALIPSEHHRYILTTVTIIGIVMRMVKQPTLAHKKEGVD